MRDVQRIAIVDPSDATREPLRNMLLGVDSVWLESECARYEFFYDVISQSPPDVAIVCLDSDQNKAVQLIGQVASEFSDLPILAVSGRNDGQAILQALRNGAREFLTAPVQLEELLTALKRLQRPNGTPTGDSGTHSPLKNGKQESSVIAVLGSTGGVGCTSLAVNLGATLAQNKEYSVSLIDLDLAMGDCDVALDLMGDYTLADVALNIDRLDMAFLKRSLCRHSSGVSLLPHPVQLEDCQLIREEHLQRLINLLRASYSHLVLDLSKSFSPLDVTGLRMADHVLLVAQLDLSSLRNVVRMMLTLGHDETIGPKVKIVLNRVGGDSEITIAKAEEIIGKPIFLQIPNDVKSVLESRNNGVPLVQHAPRSKAQQSIQALTMALTGKEVQAAGARKARWFWQTSS
jgi:pilus assembly protein CpaE